MLETRPFDPAEHIRDREEAGFYMDAALRSGDPADIVDALDVIARALGQAEPGLSPEAGLHRVGHALETLGFRLSAHPVANSAEAA